MIKAKTNKKILAILSAVLSAVFAIIIGGTYCATSLNLSYKTNPNTSAVYAMNNHYHVNNDTLINPVLFGSGSHNFEISFEYDVPYEFDLRLQYAMKWGTSGKSTDNVIINYANRDNLVVDQNYIYLVSNITNKSGKINIIVGVDFVDPTNSYYDGERLTIEITDVKVCERGVTYDADHPLVKNVSSQAADMWLKIKQNITTSSAIVYNYRYDYAHGASFPGDDTAYYKVIEQRTSTTNGNTVTYNVVQSATWAGGNRAYAGVGMYVYAGTTLKIDVAIAGIWRLEASNAVTDSISESGIKFNYTEDFEHESWDNSKLWETKKFNYYIPAGESRFINILDSIEITTPSLKTLGIKKDEYRAICQSIKINGVTLEYTESGIDQSVKTISSLTSSSVATSTTAYQSKLVEAVNSTAYLGGLYQIQTQTTEAISQSYSADISLVNNTSNIQSATATMNLRYRISNDNRSLTQITGEGQNQVIKRVEDLYPANGTSEEAVEQANISRLNDASLFYTFSPKSVISTTTQTVKIAPYSSVNVLNYYTASKDLQSQIISKYGNYDVWLYYDVSVSYSTETSVSNLQIETRQNGNDIDIYAKNNTQQVATITDNTLKVKERIISYKQPAEVDQPHDWLATFWQYHIAPNYAQNTSIDFDTEKAYHLRELTYEDLSISGKVSSGTLNPGEVIKIGTVTAGGTKDLLFTGGVTASLEDLNEIVLSNKGTVEAVLINGTINAGTKKSVYIRIAGVLSSENDNDKLVESGGYIYYVGILRPGQKICIPMTSGTGEISTINAGDVYTSSALNIWNDDSITSKFNSLFNTTKT